MFKALIASVAMAAAAITCAGAASAATENLIQNGDFSQGVIGWDRQGPSIGFQAVETPNNVEAIGGGRAGVKNYLSQDITTTVGQNYTLSFDLKSVNDSSNPNSSSFQAGLDLNGPDAKALVTIANKAFDFTNYVLTFTAVSPETEVGFMMEYAAGWFELDNVTLTEGGDVSAVPVPGSLILFASGLSLIGFVAWRNKRGGFARSAAA